MTTGKRGRPKTGRTTTVVRLSNDIDVPLAKRLYYDVLPIIQRYQKIADAAPNSVRNEKLIAFLEEIGRL